MNGNGDDARTSNRSAEFELRGAAITLRITRPLPNAWRLQTARPDGTFDDRGAAQVLAGELRETLDEVPAPVEAVETGPRAWRLTSPGCASLVELCTDPFRLVLRTGDGHCRAEIDGLSVHDGAVRAGGPLQRTEHLYGTGERFDSADQRGRRVVIWAEDRWCETEGNSYLPVPFVFSTAGYGLFVNRFEGMVLDLGAEDPDCWEVSELAAPLDLYVFVDRSPRAVLNALAGLTGRAPVPPEWAFGVLVSRHARTKEFAAPDGVREMARRMAESDLAWSGVIIEGWPTYDRARWGELKSLVEELHAAGKKVLVYDACGRVRGSLIGEAGASSEHCVRYADGQIDIEEAAAYNPADAPDRRRSRFLDVTSPGAVAWWTGDVWARLLEEVGLDGAKIDFCEQFPEHDDLVLRDGRSPRGMHHYFPVKYNTLMYRLFQSKRPAGGVCWSRGGGIGAARYPFAWCGDQLREFRFLRAILVAALSSGLSGVPFMGHDLGGYMPTKDPEDNPEPAVFVRGAQLACFSPVMSPHGTVTRPYDFEGPIVDLYRTYSRVHYALIPYLIEQAREGCAKGLPLMRHLVLCCPDDKFAQGTEDEYLLGEDVLVAPVLDGKESRNVYLPSGRWEDLWEGIHYRGPCQLASFPAPLERIPVFVADPPSSVALPRVLESVRSLGP